jgi:dihydroorotate dehydrogenase
MKFLIHGFRSFVFDLFYLSIFKPYFFSKDPESIHQKMVSAGQKIGQCNIAKLILKSCFCFEDKILNTNLSGLKIKNPIGLAAGFDKDGELTDIMPSVGFGYMEIGSVTGLVCSGNPKPRLWRLPKSKGLVVYYGLRNNGCEEIINRLESKINKIKNFEIPLGVSVAMTNIAENGDVDNAVLDFFKAFKKSTAVADYITINISCPNITCDSKMFLEPENLEKLLAKIDQIKFEKPVFVKMSPDLEKPEIDKILEVLDRHKIDGIICTNLTKKRDKNLILDEEIPSKGGISGLVVQKTSDELLAYIFKKAGHRFVLIGCGGIFSAQDLYRKIRLGASAVQIITGMIYQGPHTIGKLNRQLAKLLKRDGFKNISEAVGIDNL